jgi:hypothetical protein
VQLHSRPNLELDKAPANESAVMVFRAEANRLIILTPKRV